MLDIHDTEVVRDWLTLALAAAEKGGKSKADLARHCKVSPQAVNGWLRTGRITKHNLELAAGFFGHSPSFVHIGSQVREAPRARRRDAPPAAPPADFADDEAPTESDWQLLRDLKWIPQDERDALLDNVHQRAVKQRAHTEELIERLNRNKDKQP